MATIIENGKGFKVIHCTAIENYTKMGGIGVCDSCYDKPKEGFYIAVLNKWYCGRCYQKFHETARRYEEDTPIEDKNFKAYSEILGIVPDKS